MRGSRIAATRSQSPPRGGCGSPTTRCASTDTESSVSSHSPSVVGNDAVGGPAGQFAQLVEPGCEQGGVTAELVDHEAGDESLVVGLEHRDRPVQVGQQPAAVDVADEDDRQVRGPRQPHVGQIGCTQVDLGGRARRLRR